jgi:hypothetical protein
MYTRHVAVGTGSHGAAHGGNRSLPLTGMACEFTSRPTQGKTCSISWARVLGDVLIGCAHHDP